MTITKKNITLLLMAIAVIIPQLILFYNNSSMAVNAGTVSQRTMEAIKESQSFVVAGVATIPIDIDMSDPIPVTYYLRAAHNNAQKVGKVSLAADPDFKSQAIEIHYSEDRMIGYVSGVDADNPITLFDEKHNFYTGDHLSKAIKTLISSATGKEFKRHGIAIVSNGKQVKKWGYTLKYQISGSKLKQFVTNLDDSLQDPLLLEQLKNFQDGISSSEIEVILSTDSSHVLSRIEVQIKSDLTSKPVTIKLDIEFSGN